MEEGGGETSEMVSWKVKVREDKVEGASFERHKGGSRTGLEQGLKAGDVTESAAGTALPILTVTPVPPEPLSTPQGGSSRYFGRSSDSPHQKHSGPEQGQSKGN